MAKRSFVEGDHHIDAMCEEVMSAIVIARGPLEYIISNRYAIAAEQGEKRCYRNSSNMHADARGVGFDAAGKEGASLRSVIG